MYKEILIIITVIALVVGFDILANNYTKNSVKTLTEDLNILQDDILKENKKNAQDLMEQIQKKWRERYNVLAYYIEHDELEKVETQLTSMEANLSVGEYEQAINDLNTTKFILSHIEEKEKFDLRSIF